jgi:hypothetical protein
MLQIIILIIIGSKQRAAHQDRLTMPTDAIA